MEFFRLASGTIGGIFPKIFKSLPQYGNLLPFKLSFIIAYIQVIPNKSVSWSVLIT